MKAKRITVKEVKAAYKATGEKPIRRYAESADGCCAIGAVALAAGVKSKRMAWAMKQYGERYASGFGDGFDGEWASVSHADDDYRLGHADGRSADKAIFGAV